MLQVMDRERGESTADLRGELRSLRQDIRVIPKPPSVAKLATSDEVSELLGWIKSGVVLLVLLMSGIITLILIYMGWFPL